MDGSDHHSSCIGLVSSPGQLRFSFKLLEVDRGRITSHLQLSHPLLVDLLNGGVPELGLELLYEILPMRISVLEPIRILMVIDPVALSMMSSPVAHAFEEVGGHEDDHEG